jgi:hypothetical protein
MKRIIFLVTVSLFSVAATAQNYEEIKNLLILNGFDKAKTEIDKAMGNAKFAGKAEAYILKTAVYAGLAVTDANKNNENGDKLITEAITSFDKYKQMDATMKLIDDPVYQTGPVNIYSNLYSRGYNDYSAKKWTAGLEKFKKVIELSDLLIEKKILSIPMDTNALILGGITAENAGAKDDAAKYYTRLAEAKMSGADFESIYRFLVSYNFGKKNMAGFEKYKTLGAELYPKSEFFKYDKIDFAVGLMEKFDDKINALNEVLASDPNNFKANQVMGEIIYDTLNSGKEGAVLPANAPELESKMVAAFTKSASVKPGYEVPYLYMGDHFINKAVKANDAREAHAKDMKARTKPGTKSSPEDVAKRDLLDKQYGDALVLAKEPYEKACEILATKVDKADNSMVMQDKTQYKKAVSYLSDIAAYKKIQSKGKAADIAKFTAEEKKWNDLYDTISKMKDKKKE